MATIHIWGAENLLALDWDQLTAEEKREFPYLDTDALRSEATFFRFRGTVYDAAEFDVAQPVIARLGDWTGMHHDTYSSGVLFKYAEHSHDRAQMAIFAV